MERSSFIHKQKSLSVPPRLLEGVEVWKITANGRKIEPATLTVSADKFTISVIVKKPRAGFFLRRVASTESAHHDSHSNGSNGSTKEKDTRVIDVGAIDRIQRGQKFMPKGTRRLSDPNVSRGGHHQNEADKVSPERSFSIIFRGRSQMDLMAKDSMDRDELLDGLDFLILTYQESKNKVASDVLLLRSVWLDADKDMTGKINCNQLGRILERINLAMKRQQLNSTYEKFGKVIGLDRAMRRKGLNFEQCCTFLHKLKRDSWMVKPVTVLWNDVFGEFMNNGKPRMTVSDKTFLERFLHRKQAEKSATLEQVSRTFAALHQMEITFVNDVLQNDLSRIDKNRFEAYLLSSDNDAFDPERERFDRRLMTRPISEYWINSSHNTYLTGDQFTSHSSVDMYTSALYRGCRCLELDIWDGEREATNSMPVPVVWHGHTMTTKILFEDIIKAIKHFLNFNPHVFPIVLSFENHCSIPYQEVMAEQLVRILGKSLYVPPENSLFGLLPSPTVLRGLVVIKGRRPLVGVGDDGYDTDEDSDDEGNVKSMSDESKSQLQQIRQHGVAPQLAKLTLFHGTKHKSWDESVQSPTHHMHSFTESKVRTMFRQNKSKKWAVYNQSHMTRTYPAGARVDSSNYSPLLAWSVGCQMVSLNFQTTDVALRSNDGRFRENGGCGYVLKPSSILSDFDPTQPPPVPVKLSIRILSGSNLPKPRGESVGECIDPYIRVSVLDVKAEGKEKETTHATDPFPGNGFFPIWNHEKFTFIIESAAIAMLQISVYDKEKGSVVGSDEFIAGASIPISCLRRGIRSVKLFDAHNTRSGAFDFASLLVEIRIERAVGEV
ncbi:Inactive phospholipase C-like protein 1 [Seminavis robusta]|uniref:Phosphoinositide phospholipase C n=1 Tax=Seminavis robusta TaxID=568900 RepID=A0A9N8H8L5_9STRA|nr:Inactive phospholipase C-like protein 1 [Seminavis robusta]|eukprot:Sro245_g097340.1 Inactive phospholipase C-like protein 1 (834) ;mRNA; f:26641-29438